MMDWADRGRSSTDFVGPVRRYGCDGIRDGCVEIWMKLHMDADELCVSQ